jgi:hypothetical protein
MATQFGWNEAVAQELEAQLSATIQRLADSKCIHNVMDISTFLNPVDEIVDDPDGVILDSIVDAYVEADRDRETDEETQPMSIIKQQEAMQAVQLLQRYEEQQEDGDNEILSRLGQLELTVQRRMFNSQKQIQITSYFG